MQLKGLSRPLAYFCFHVGDMSNTVAQNKHKNTVQWFSTQENKTKKESQENKQWFGGKTHYKYHSEDSHF